MPDDKPKKKKGKKGKKKGNKSDGNASDASSKSAQNAPKPKTDLPKLVRATKGAKVPFIESWLEFEIDARKKSIAGYKMRYASLHEDNVRLNKELSQTQRESNLTMKKLLGKAEEKLHELFAASESFQAKRDLASAETKEFAAAQEREVDVLRGQIDELDKKKQAIEREISTLKEFKHTKHVENAAHMVTLQASIGEWEARHAEERRQMALKFENAMVQIQQVADQKIDVLEETASLSVIEAMDEKCRRDIQDHAWLTHEISIHLETLRRIEEQIAELEQSNVDLMQGSLELSLESMRWGNFDTYRRLDNEPVTLTLPALTPSPAPADTDGPSPPRRDEQAWQSPPRVSFQKTPGHKSPWAPLGSVRLPHRPSSRPEGSPPWPTSIPYDDDSDTDSSDDDYAREALNNSRALIASSWRRRGPEGVAGAAAPGGVLIVTGDPAPTAEHDATNSTSLVPVPPSEPKVDVGPKTVGELLRGAAAHGVSRTVALAPVVHAPATSTRRRGHVAVIKTGDVAK